MNDGGAIILIGSVASVKGTPAFGTYGATKAAVRNLARAWTMELKDRRIRSNVLSPGPNQDATGRSTTTRSHREDPNHHSDGTHGENRTKSPKQRCSWPQTIPALSRASNYSSMAAEVKFDQRKRRGGPASKSRPIRLRQRRKRNAVK